MAPGAAVSSRREGLYTWGPQESRLRMPLWPGLSSCSLFTCANWNGACHPSMNSQQPRSDPSGGEVSLLNPGLLQRLAVKRHLENSCFFKGGIKRFYWRVLYRQDPMMLPTAVGLGLLQPCANKKKR